MSKESSTFHIRNCQVPGCNADSSLVIVYAAKHSKDLEKYKRWHNMLSLSELTPSVYACQRHFPAGAPTKNNPDPDIKLFNPLPKINNDRETGLNIIPLVGGIVEFDDKTLPSSIGPPPGSILKLAPNATLIDLKKIREKHSFNKPIRIEEVTVIIDEQDQVKVIDYGPKDKRLEAKIRNGKAKHRRSIYSTFEEEGEEFEEFLNSSKELNFQTNQESSSLGIILEKMRRFRIDCNLSIIDAHKRKPVYAHRAVLVARSPYFYRQVYLRRKRKKLLNEFCRCTLPIQVDHDVLDEVISFMYTGSFKELLQKNVSEVCELFSLFEMKDELERFNKEIEGREKVSIKMESMDDDLSVMVMPFNDDESTPVIEVTERRPELEKKRKKRASADPDGGEDYRGRLKVSVQKIVDTALNPFLEKLDEMFNPLSSTLRIAETSQHIITLWHANILLTKMFDQNDLTTFFSDVMSKVLAKNLIQVKVQNVRSDEVGGYTVETFYTQTGNSVLDESYTKPYVSGTLDEFLQQSNIPLRSLSDETTEVYNCIDAKHIPKFVHLVAMYRFQVVMKKKGMDIKNENNSSDTLIPSIIEGEIIPENSHNSTNDIDDLVNRMTNDGQLFSTFRDSCFQKVNLDLKRRIVADLELYVNPSYHEELIVHLIVDQMNTQCVLPFTMGIFLGKGCNFCRKKECKSEDLTIPITPDNPMCPDRQCIKKNLQCSICYKQMSTSKSLARHKYGVHDIETGDTSGIFICSHCGETFSKKWKLNIHEREHEDKKLELTCKYCKKKIRGASAMKKHVAMVHEAKPQFSCEFCAKVFKRRETLCVHRRIHTGEKPFICNHCEYASETKGNLKAHVLRKHKQTVTFRSQGSRANMNQKKRIINSKSKSNRTHHVLDIQAHNVMDDPTNSVMDEPEHSVIGDSTHNVMDVSSHSVMDVQTHTVIREEGVSDSATDDQVMAATIVAHSLSDGSFIITETSSTPLVP